MKIALFLVFLLAACADSPMSKRSQAPDSPVGTDWKQNMQRLSENLSILLPMVVSDREFNKPENIKPIQDLTVELANLAHSVNSNKSPPGNDPSLMYISREFRAEVVDVLADLKLGNRKSARERLRGATQYCISCHTLNEAKTTGFSLELSSDLGGLNTLERAEYFTATRRFDQAVLEYEKDLTNPRWARKNTKLWNAAVQRLLAILVRVDNDPSLTLEMISRFFDSKTYPKNLTQEAQQWRLQAKAWRSEPEYHMTGDQLLGKARELFKQAQKVKGPHEAALIYYLRSSGFLHDFLRTKGKNESYHDALWIGGVVAEALGDVNLWTLPADFYEGCVRSEPKGPLAEDCFKALKRVDHAHYAKIGDGKIPAYAEDRLTELGTLMTKQ